MAKILFNRHPEMNEFQYLTLRSIVHTVVILAILYGSIRKALWDTLPQDKVGLILFRVGTGVGSFYFVFQAIKIIPLFHIALIINLMPLFTAFFAYYILVEKLSRIEKTSLIISFIGVFVLIEGGKD